MRQVRHELDRVGQPPFGHPLTQIRAQGFGLDRRVKGEGVLGGAALVPRPAGVPEGERVRLNYGLFVPPEVDGQMRLL